jgi:hydrogenase/urease accessory protein HupE
MNEPRCPGGAGRRRAIGLCLAALLLLPAVPAQGHELTPALLSIEEQAGDVYDVVWRVPLDEAPRGLLAPILPDGAQPLGPREVQTTGLARTEHWRVRVPGGLGGRSLRLEGPPSARTDALLRLALAGGAVLHGRLSPGGQPFIVPTRPPSGARAVASAYLGLGVEHILLGLDHLLFVLGLILLSPSLRSLLATITAFTAAHSVTLALAALGVLHVPGPPVEATIALSIVFVARELVSSRPSLAARRPWLVALTFGLLHGLGFAGALAQIGLPVREVPLALAAFNVGVELGQLAFVAAALALSRALAQTTRRRLRPLAAYGIGGAAFAILLGRLAAL